MFTLTNAVSKSLSRMSFTALESLELGPPKAKDADPDFCKKGLHKADERPRNVVSRLPISAFASVTAMSH